MRFALVSTSVFLGLTAPGLAQTAATAPSLGEQRFQAAPLPLRFAILGEYGSTTPESFAVAALVRRLDPHLVLTLGGNNHPGGGADTIDENVGQHYHGFLHPYQGSFGDGAELNRFFPCLGELDWLAPGAQPYLDYFELPGNERTYDFRRGPVHFFALDSAPQEPDGRTRDSAQAAWLEGRLGSSSAPFKIVYLHHAPYSSGANHGSLGDVQWPFKEWGASLVVAGRDQLYERLSISGLPYVVNGFGGAASCGLGRRLGGSEVLFRAEHGALLVEADSSFARLRFLSASGTVQDDFVLPRGGVDPGVTELISEDALWRYLDTGLDPGPGWAHPGFDDSGWANGRAQLGYGEGDEATTVGFGGDPGNRFVTTWFRRPFFLARPDEFESFQLRLLHDDGAVVYLNGVEVVRVGMPEGAITAGTLASSSTGGSEETTLYPFTFPAAGLAAARQAAGRNVLAVELHQASASSNDLGFAAELVGLGRGRTLITRSAHWRYLDTGVAPDETWTEPGFDDAHWPSGRAQLGHGEGDEATRVASGNTTTWLRKTFTVPQAAAVRWLSCRLLRDDGVIVYLNGQEAARFNLPAAGVTPDTFASFNVNQEQEHVFESTSLDPRLLVEGANTIAVELHQSSGPMGGDLSFDLELVAH